MVAAVNEHRTRFKDKTVVITGASAGVGYATALAFAREGANIALIARGEAALSRAASKIEKLGGRALPISTDVANPNEVFRAAERIEAELGVIDIWVNNAMVTVFSPIADLLPEEARRVTEVTYLGTVYGTMAALARMRPRNRGTIVQIGSGLAHRGIPLQSAYCGAKHAVRGFTTSLLSELIHEGSSVRVTSVHLPAINTPQFSWARTKMGKEPRPVPPTHDPDVAARAVLKAAADAGRDYWLGFSTIKVVLGNAILPAWLDRYLAKFAWEGQQMDQVAPKGRCDNLFFPRTPLHALQGPFVAEARKTAPLVTGWKTRLWFAASGGILLVIVGALLGMVVP